jgi:protein MpaA
MVQNIIHQSCFGVTAKGEALNYFFSIHKKEERPLFFIGGVHGDEPEGVVLAKNLLSWLQKNNTDELNSWLLVPCLNVDGYKSNQRTNSRGVDLNRNFPSHDWSSDHKAPRYYPGPYPKSEIETQMIVRLIEEYRPRCIVHFHSWEPCVVYTGPEGKKFADIVAETTGYRVSEDIGYPTPGSLGQYGWLNCKIPVICVEEKENSDLDSIWPRFQSGLISLLRQK